jgi:flagellin
MIQVADGGMSGINENMQRVRTLTLQASNGIMNDSDRAIIQKEIDTLMQSSDDIAKNTSYNDIKLLDGTGGSSGDGTFIAQTGAYSGDSQSIKIGDAQVSTLVGSIDVTTQAGRDAALGTIDSGMSSINEIRAELGATQNQLASNISNVSLTQVNVAAAESQMRDVDFALESANFSKANIMSQIGSFAQSQANASKANLAGLLG